MSAPNSDSDVASMSYRRLQKECREALLPASGDTSALKKRLLDKKENDRKTKRLKSATDELVCPITLELPFDPVIAEDGRVYERSAIEQHIATQQRGGRQLKSPMTNTPMGERLMSSPQQKNLIAALIEGGVIAGELAEKWNEKANEMQFKEELVKKAEGGDAKAMYQVAGHYRDGKNGFKKDYKLSYQWYQKSHAAGNVKGTARIGFLLCCGRGVAKCCNKGTVYLGMAASAGSDFAAFHLGMAFAEGKFGLAADYNEAIVWLQKCLCRCPHRHMRIDTKDKAQKKLQDLQNATA